MTCNNVRRASGSFFVRLAAVTFALAFLAGCGSTQIVHSWTSPEFKAQPFRKVLVIGLASRPEVRRVYEDAFVKQLQASGADGVASYTVLADSKTADKAAIVQAASQSGADAVLLTHLVKTEKQSTAATLDIGVQERIDGAWPGTYTPVGVNGTDVVTLESRLFAATTTQLVWRATTETFDAANLQPAIMEVSQTIVKQLAKQKML